MKSIVSMLFKIPTVLFNGYVFSQFWNWFLIRKFPSLPTLEFLDGVGIMMVISFPLFGLFWADAMREQKKDKKPSDQATIDIISSIIMLFVVYPLMLGVGYLWHLVIK